MDACSAHDPIKSVGCADWVLMPALMLSRAPADNFIQLSIYLCIVCVVACVIG